MYRTVRVATPGTVGLATPSTLVPDDEFVIVRRLLGCMSYSAASVMSMVVPRLSYCSDTVTELFTARLFAPTLAAGSLG